MKIIVKFDKSWTREEIEEYISDPNAEKHTSLPDDLHLELVACAEYYATKYCYADAEDIDVDQHVMNESAAQSIANGIQDYFDSEMYDNYYEDYVLQTAAHLDKTRSEHYAQELGLSVPECTSITLGK